MIFLLCILDPENREHTNFNSLNYAISKILICKLILTRKFQNVPCAIDFAVKHSKKFSVEASGDV